MAPAPPLSTPLDPVCGMRLEQPSVTLDYDGRTLAFCSEFCRQQFQRHPRAYDQLRARPVARGGWAGREIAYFSMEIALDNAIQTYSGGLGVLAGDTLASCADLRVPVVAVSLVHRKGYFRQDVVDGAQFERDARWSPEQYAHPLEQRVR